MVVILIGGTWGVTTAAQAKPKDQAQVGKQQGLKPKDKARNQQLIAGQKKAGKNKQTGMNGQKRVHGNNGLGNGIDPQPPGNPPVNDGPGAFPGNPGNRMRGRR
jgi:hypothetical protein